MDIGQTVVVRGRGLGTVTAIRDGVIIVAEQDLRPGEESQFEIPVERAGEAIRALATRDEAERMLALIATKPARPPAGDRSIAYRRAYKQSDLEAQARALAMMYAGPVEAPETQYQDLIEKNVYGELGLVLGLSRKALRAKIRSAALREATPRSLALADRSKELESIALPDVDGFEPIGAFAVDATIAVGEARADAKVAAEPGVWLAYAARDDDDFSELLAVHQASAADIAKLRKRAKQIGEAPIEGAHIAIFDGAIPGDRDVMDRMYAATCDIIEGRGAALGLGGDGVADVRAVLAGKRAICVRVIL